MKNTFRTGIVYGLVYYTLGSILSIILHISFDWGGYAHAPPPTFLIIILVIIGGFLRLLWNWHNIRLNVNRLQNKGELIVHLFPLIMLILLFMSFMFID